MTSNGHDPVSARDVVRAFKRAEKANRLAAKLFARYVEEELGIQYRAEGTEDTGGNRVEPAHEKLRHAGEGARNR